MIPQTPVILPMPFAQNGERHEIPENNTVAGSPDASWNLGFPPVTGINKQAGGKPPTRLDFQGILHTLSQHIFYLQSGGVYPWMGASDDFPGLNYLQGSRVIGSNGQVYAAIQASGPDVTGSSGAVGPVDPVTDIEHNYWVPVIPDAPAWNRVIVITESGEWEAKVTGWYEVTVINGGDGGYCCQRNVWAGAPGACSKNIVWLEKGQIINVTIGAGGKGQDRRNDSLWNSAYGALVQGGASSFGDIDSSTGDITWRDQGEFMQAPGDGRCNLAPRAHIAGEFYFGKGGVGAWAGTGLTPSGASATNGEDGAVIVKYFDSALANGPATDDEEGA